MKTTIIIGSAIFIIACILFIIVFSMFSCMTAPDRENFKTDECYLAIDCLYRNKDNKDKSICVALIKSCCDTMSENRYRKRLEYCNKKRPESMTERECQAWLNQK